MPYTGTELWEMIESSDEICCSALVQLYYRQTEDEQENAETTHFNGRGFNATDAQLLSSFAEHVLVNRRLRENGKFKHKSLLSPRQLAIARVRLRKYLRQLVEIACEKELARQTEEIVVDVAAAGTPAVCPA